ncbi:MAG TPA: hypothetical protein VGR67_15135 [Candidatus Polarisedimenticolia bacterium]|jgi:hypothetical protein|nr:hypothetical protein [Candidatus Polarisedimenticolia bacterium]
MTKKTGSIEAFPMEEGLLSVRAGESVVLNIGALDRQSGVAEIRALCRSRENRDLASVGRWERGGPRPHDNYYRVPVPIPEHSPTVVWEVFRILLRDGQGNCRVYHAGRDFDEFYFHVKGAEGVDSTPPRLLGIRVDPA